MQFGEGGAGTFSDGKLWSQISDPRHLTRKVLDEFVKAGAPEEILYVGKPHIGTFRLVGVVEKMRAEIEALGGEIRFGAARRRPADRGRRTCAASTRRASATLARPASGATIAAEHVVLALGHSARDTFADAARARRRIIEAKPFSIGFRIEHPQSLIDRARFGPAPAIRCSARPTTSSCTTRATAARSTASACARAAPWSRRRRSPSRVVTNGMSQYSRNERNANAGIVVGIAPADYRAPGAAPRRCARSPASPSSASGNRAPSSSAAATTARRASASATSRAAGRRARSAACCRRTSRACADRPRRDRRAVLPAYAIEAIREALPAFERQIQGFALHDAVLTGVETRTSSPLRITRGRDRQSLNVRGLYPAGEGAGYAGGIMSAGGRRHRGRRRRVRSRRLIAAG